MRKRIVITGAALLVAVVLYGNPTTAQAADQQAKATTSEMPAALLALGVDNKQVLTEGQANEVRGEGRRRFRRFRSFRGFRGFGSINVNVNININNVVQNNIAIGSSQIIQSNSSAIFNGRGFGGVQ